MPAKITSASPRAFAHIARALAFNAARAAVSVAALSAGAAYAGVPFPSHDTPAAVESGLIDAKAGNVPLSVTVALKLRDLQGAEALLQHVSTPGDPLYRHFITPAQFANRFGPADADVAKVTAALAAYGLAVERTSTTTLTVTGLPANIERAFQVSLHEFSVGATKRAAAYTFRSPVQTATMPAAIAPLVHGVFGLSTRPAFVPHKVQAAGALRPLKAVLNGPAAGTLPGQPQYYTVNDVVDYYDIKPLYKAGYTGAGQTIGIITLASFTPSDAYTYWYQVGLKVDQRRIRTYNVAGGAGAPSDDAGSLETTLDTEQSGGLAPDANILVYVAPNTTQGFVAVYAKAIDENLADAVSISWGEWEWFDNLENSPVRERGNPDKISTLDAVHALMVQAGDQGQTLFSSAGDTGAYDVNNGFLPPDWDLALSVDYPASDPANTGAGGTTLPATLTFESGQTITVPAERVWSWDYLEPLCPPFDPIECGIFPVGSGGGVSFEFPLPSYQSGVTGVQVTQPNQTFTDDDTIPPTTYFTIPANYAGRNVPDLSMNADPETGYLVGYTSSIPGSTYGLEPGWGGTSFVGPQLNGIVQLLDQMAGSRLGFLNPALYAEAAKGSTAYHGRTAPLRYVPAGNNDFYYGTRSYNPAVGLGTFDAAKLANVIAK